MAFQMLRFSPCSASINVAKASVWPLIQRPWNKLTTVANELPAHKIWTKLGKKWPLAKIPLIAPEAFVWPLILKAMKQNIIHSFHCGHVLCHYTIFVQEWTGMCKLQSLCNSDDSSSESQRQSEKRLLLAFRGQNPKICAHYVDQGEKLNQNPP